MACTAAIGRFPSWCPPGQETRDFRESEAAFFFGINGLRYRKGGNGVHLNGLVQYIDARRAAAAKELEQMTGAG